MESVNLSQTKRPWHLWLISILSILWYLSGTYTILMAQAGKLPKLSVEEAAYYSSQPIWFVILTDISLLSALIASIALIIKSRFAFRFFSLSLSTIFITNIYDLAAGTSRALANTGAMIVTILIVTIAILLLMYTWLMKKRSILT